MVGNLRNSCSIFRGKLFKGRPHSVHEMRKMKGINLESKQEHGMTTRPIPQGEDPREIVEDMKLVYNDPNYPAKVSGKKIHWSGYIAASLKDEFIKKDPNVVAIWEKDGWMVLAWIEVEE